MSATQHIFLSYGRDEHTQVARRIKADLEARGHTVWFDEDRLSPGRDWEAYIEEGLRQSDKVVLLMTPYSVRRRDPRDPASRDGFCLNEIAKALERSKLIIPVLLVSLEPDGPPTSICRVQYLDLRDAMPIESKEEVYRGRLDRLVQAIEQNNLDFEGGQARLQLLLSPLNFEAEIGQHLARFHGRDWLFQKLDRWLVERADSRVFWLSGLPGVGKSAVAARLCHQRRDVIAYHLCKAGHDDKSNPALALLSIAYQMAQHLSEYQRRLSRLNLEAEVVKNASTLFDNLLVQPLGSGFQAPDGPRLVVIDAIDEASRQGRNEIAEFIRDYWDQTPAWLRLVITSRPEAEIVTTMPALKPTPLEAHGEENLRDLRGFVEDELARLFPDVDVGPAAKRILAGSDGLFLYAQVVLKELSQPDSLFRLDRLDDFPAGMGGYYQRFFQRQFPDLVEYEQTIRPLLEAICAERDPLPLAVLGLAAGPAGVTSTLARLGSLFPVRGAAGDRVGGTITPFHKSLRDWLSDRDGATGFARAGPFAIDLARGNRMLADCVSGWQRLPAGQARRYVLRHGVSHLADAGRCADAVEFLHGLLRLPDAPPEIQGVELQEVVVILNLALGECPAEEAVRVPPDKLLDIIDAFSGIDFDTIVIPLRLIYEHHAERWRELRPRLNDTERWTVMYATSLVLAEFALKPANARTMTEVVALASSPRFSEQELGLYAVKLLAGQKGTMDLSLVREISQSQAFIVRAVLGEYFLIEALGGADVWTFIEDAGMAASPWPYHRTQMDDIAAVQSLMRAESLARFGDRPELARAHAELTETMRLRAELLRNEAVLGDEALPDRLRDYCYLPRKVQSLRQIGVVLGRSPAWAEALRVLFGHPGWEVRAAAAGLAAALCSSRPEIAGRIADWLGHADWRVRYAAVETAFNLRGRDGGALFERAVRLAVRDPQCWVRGNAADCLSEWFAESDVDANRRRFKTMHAEISTLLHDNDMWVLESMVYLVSAVRQQNLDALAFLDRPIGGLLGRIPGWATLDRPQLQPALDAVVRLA